MPRHSQCLWFVALVLVVGCHPQPHPDTYSPVPIVAVDSRPPNGATTQRWMTAHDYFTDPGLYMQDYDREAAALKKAAPAADLDDELKALRNRYLDQVLMVEDDLYSDYQYRLRGGTEIRRDLIGMVSLGLSATATFVTGGAGQVLSATDTALKGGSSLIDANDLANQTIESILNTMDARRASAKAVIITNMSTQSVAKYSLIDGIRDIVDMQKQADFISAIKALSAETGQQKSAATTQLSAAKDLTKAPSTSTK